MVPASLRFIVELNPFSHLIWCYQDALYFGGIEHPRSWIVLALMAVLSVLAGSHVFRRLQHHVASVL
jgi:lipopolysaccharide transport system permease protein